MIAVDTSVVVRYLVGTPTTQARRATTLIDGEDVIGLPVVALLETAHVLRTQYGISRADILDVLIELITRVNVNVIELPKSDAIDALVRARSLPGSPLPDALIVGAARHAGALPIYTFDDDLHRHGAPVARP